MRAGAETFRRNDAEGARPPKVGMVVVRRAPLLALAGRAIARSGSVGA